MRRILPVQDANPIMEKDLVALCQALVRIPSVFGSEGAVGEFVARTLEEKGFDRVERDHLGNAVGVIEGARPGKTLLFDAHIDTIDVVPREAWTVDPFGAAIEGDRMYGRGTSDMKGALAAMIQAATAVRREGLRGRIVISASVAEEVIEGAALKAVMERHSPDLVVIGESTDLHVARGGRGRAEFLVTAHGEPAHASTPHRGINAIHKMMRVIQALESVPVLDHEVVGPGVMALTDIISSPYPAHSVVPSRCQVTYERRLVPGETRDSVMALLEEACRKAGAEDTLIHLARVDHEAPTGVRLEKPKWFPAWVLPDDHPFLAAALAGLNRQGLSPELTAYRFCTNAAYSAGEANVPTIGFGPSREELAHVTDEYIELDQLRRAARGYLGIMESVLG